MVFWHAIAIVAIFVLGCKTGDHYAKNTIGKNKDTAWISWKNYTKRKNAIIEKDQPRSLMRRRKRSFDNGAENINEDWEGTD